MQIANSKYISSFLWTFFATTLSLRLLIYKKRRLLSKHPNALRQYVKWTVFHLYLVHVEYFSTCFSKLLLTFRDKNHEKCGCFFHSSKRITTICEMNSLFGYYGRQCVLFSMWKTLVNEHVLHWYSLYPSLLGSMNINVLPL